jgi:hypothetical protein
MRLFLLIIFVSSVLRAESGGLFPFNSKSKISNKDRSPASLNESFQKSFGAEDCRGVREKAKEYKDEIKKLDTFSLALMAYCEEDFSRSERIFKIVDKMSPNDELIVTLHARSLTNRKNENAWEEWNKLLRIAKSKILLDLANEMLQNHEWVEAPDYSNRTIFYSLGMDLGTLYYSNPSSSSISSTYDGSPTGSIEVRPSLIKQWQSAVISTANAGRRRIRIIKSA